MTRKKILGCIADDFTGATDLANNLVRCGMRVVQVIGIPDFAIEDDVDAIVVSLKSRTVPAAIAVDLSLKAYCWLMTQNARQIYFKYCSTFDSTAEGNIGPVIDALMTAMDCNFTIACPAFPEAGRSVFKGYLFVGDQLLHESGMRDHPLTPMTDSNLVRVLQSQTSRQVGLIDHVDVGAGVEAILAKMNQLQAQGKSIAIVDAVDNSDLLTLGSASSHLKLITAGSGVALGLPQNFDIAHRESASRLPPASGLKAIVSGSCSTATNAQVADFIAKGGNEFAIDPLRLAAGEDVVEQALHYASKRLDAGPCLFYATAEPGAVRQVQEKLGVDAASHLVENALARIAQGLVDLGVRQMIVAGGETSGACVQELHINHLRIGPPIAPGVPWCHTTTASGTDLHIALKSGNFGGLDFFTSSFAVLN